MAIVVNDKEIQKLIGLETRRQREGLEMIPSENHTSPDVLAAHEVVSVRGFLFSTERAGLLAAHLLRQKKEGETLRSMALKDAPTVPQAVWLEMVKAASKTLDIEEFYIADQAGEVLEPVIEAVKAAARRGVKVRLIVDSVMMKESGKSLPPLREAGVAAVFGPGTTIGEVATFLRENVRPRDPA